MVWTSNRGTSIVFLSYLNFQIQTHGLSVFKWKKNNKPTTQNLWSEYCNELIRFSLCNSLNISALWQCCSFTHWISKQQVEVNLDLLIPFGLEENLRQAQSDGRVPSNGRALSLSHRVQWPGERLVSSLTIFETKGMHQGWKKSLRGQRCLCYSSGYNFQSIPDATSIPAFNL